MTSQPEPNDHLQRWPQRILAVCRLLEDAEQPPALNALASEIGTSAATLRRHFERRLGITPQAYAQALRLNRLARNVGRSAGNPPRALEAVFNAGFGSSSAGYQAASDSLGTAPGALGKIDKLEMWLGLSELGWMLMAATKRGICWLAFGDTPETLQTELRDAFPNARWINGEDRLRRWFERVREYILLPQDALDLPLDVRGTAFQAAVWSALRKVPLGETRSYTEIAKALGKPRAARAVATACASNRIAVAIPCHRVIAADGDLAGYRWGVSRKAELLQREAERD